MSALSTPEPDAVSPAARIDIRDLVCPLTWVRTRIALGRIRPGEVLEVLLAEGEPLENVPATAEAEGHRALRLERAVAEGAGVFRLWLERGASREEGEWP